MMRTKVASNLFLVFLLASVSAANALDTVTAALTSKAFQYVPLVIAQDRG